MARLSVVTGVFLGALTTALPWPLASARAESAIRPVRHGQELTAAMVGPMAAGRTAGQSYPGATIRDDTRAPFLRRVDAAASYDGFPVAGPHLLIEGVTFSGPLDIYAKLPLVLRGVSVRIEGASYWGVLTRAEAGPFFFLWSEVGGAVDAGPRAQPGKAGVQRGLYLAAPGAVVYRSHASRSADGIQVHASGIRVIETLIDELTTWEGEHNDGIQVIGRGERLTVRRSRIVNPNPQTSCILLQRGGHVIEDSYLSGGGWVIYGGATAKVPDIEAARGVRITGTVFGQEFGARSGTFGPIADWDGRTTSGNVWRANRFADGRPVEPAVPVDR